jgi:hypothetical protein
MGYVIGDNAIGINTWGKLRRAVTQGAALSLYDNNVVYSTSTGAFKTEEGNGMIVGGLTTALFRAQPEAVLDTGTFSMTYFDVRYEAVLTGETVTTDLAETFAIDGTAFSSPYQTVSPTPASNTIADIGLFDPI